MIRIKYRLDGAAEKEYIDKALLCIDNVKEYSDKLEALLVEMRRKGEAAAGKILTEARRFRTDYPDSWCLCGWLVMSYEDMAEIRKYQYALICSGLREKNAAIKGTGYKIKEIKSYHDLQRRRNINYAAPTINKIMSAHIDYDDTYDAFKRFNEFYEAWPESGINYWITEKTGLKVCPYCNISYTYSRGNTVTAQLDHFFPKSEYPILALCFYNLVPSCPACNKMKLDDTEEMASPYKDGAFQNLRITWEYAVRNQYGEKDSLSALEDIVEIMIEAFEEDEQHNLTRMKIREAYQQHRDYASEIIKKAMIYTNPEAQRLICDVSESVGITPEEIERFYLGNYLDENDLKNRPLSKMTKDFYQEIIYAKNRLSP